MSSGAFEHEQRRAPADEPRSPTLVLSYPHLRPSLEPKRLRREEIWAVAEEARRQLCRGPRPKVDLIEIAKRTSRLQVNGLAFEARWELDQAVTDDAGQPVFGALDHDPAWPQRATISLNGTLIDGRSELARSTAAHELGHAIFETPAWIQSEAIVAGTPSRNHRFTKSAQEDKAGAEMDWVEWRANEFMGAFLAPRSMLHRYMHKRAAGLAIPMIESGRRDELPGVCPRTLPPLIDEVVGELAEGHGRGQGRAGLSLWAACQSIFLKTFYSPRILS